MGFMGFVRLRHFSLLSVLLLSLLAVPGEVQPAAAQGSRLQSFATDTLEIVTASGRHSFRVELAETEEQRAQGLMFRPALASDAAMLFIYPSDRVISMWMKNTLIPLDMLFVAANGRVVGLHERAVPHSLRSISSGTPARGVVELPGGTIGRLGIRRGDRVITDRLGAAP